MIKNADITQKSKTLGKLWNIHTKIGKEFLTYGNIEIEKKILPSKDSFYFFFILFYFIFGET